MFGRIYVQKTSPFLVKLGLHIAGFMWHGYWMFEAFHILYTTAYRLHVDFIFPMQIKQISFFFHLFQNNPLSAPSELLLDTCSYVEVKRLILSKKEMFSIQKAMLFWLPKSYSYSIMFVVLFFLKKKLILQNSK